MSDAFWGGFFVALAAVVTQVLLHLRAMKKMDLQEKERATSRDNMQAALLQVHAQVSDVASQTNGMHTQGIKMAYELGRQDGETGRKTDLGTLD